MDDEAYQRLLDRFRSRLEAELADIDRPGEENIAWGAPVELDQQSVGRVSLMDALQMQSISQAVRRRQAARRIAVEQALNRMNEREFGHCIECGEPIPRGRLDVDPTFAACVRCAK